MKKLKSIAKKLNPAKLVGIIVKFLKDSVNELRTVTWLSRKDTVKFTVYILLFIFVSAIAIAFIDLGLYKVVTFITTRS